MENERIIIIEIFQLLTKIIGTLIIAQVKIKRNNGSTTKNFVKFKIRFVLNIEFLVNNMFFILP